jgi:glycosyltransferase involved in cell wall biosynthesis
MKLIAVLEDSVIAGGGFNQALSAIQKMQRICENRFEFEVFTTQPENVPYLNQFGINSVNFSFSLMDRFLARLSINTLWQTIQSRIKIVGAFEKKMVAHGCDLVYFVTPSGYAGSLQRLNYIITVWDTCHRDMPEFPEVRKFNQFFIRERIYQNYLSPAVVVLVDSVNLADSIAFRYGVDRTRLLPAPFSPSPFLSSELAKTRDEVLAKYSLEAGYFFYPAQFWAHKNHIRILEAILLLNRNGVQHTVVFAGGDQGNRAHVERFVEQNDLGSQVRFLGFVPTDDMRGLYEACRAVLMPTYFGPTNVPPLEAWMLGKPLIYSVLYEEQVKDAAVLVDPDDAAQLASAITSCMDQAFCEQIVKAGRSRLNALDNEIKASEDELLVRLNRFEKRLHCWSEQ